jgi:hypothetical protein
MPSTYELGHELSSVAFCSYCGHPPRNGRGVEHRVCERCGQGVMLRAAQDTTLRPDEPFLIVDRRLVVQAVSRKAESVLAVDEPAAVGCPLDEFLVGGDSAELAPLLARATDEARAAETIELWTVGGGGKAGVGLRARVGVCGPPAATLIVLAGGRAA